MPAGSADPSSPIPALYFWRCLLLHVEGNSKFFGSGGVFCDKSTEISRFSCRQGLPTSSGIPALYFWMSVVHAKGNNKIFVFSRCLLSSHWKYQDFRAARVCRSLQRNPSSLFFELSFVTSQRKKQDFRALEVSFVTRQEISRFSCRQSLPTPPAESRLFIFGSVFWYKSEEILRFSFSGGVFCDKSKDVNFFML